MKDSVFNELIQLEHIQNNETAQEFRVHVNPDDHIFDGHFPGQPILPGVVIAECVKRAVALAVQAAVNTEKLSFVKFMNPVVPSANSVLELNLQIASAEGQVKASAVLSEGDKTYSKVKGIYTYAS